MPKQKSRALSLDLARQVRRVFPTAARLVLHEQLVLNPVTRQKSHIDHLHAFDREQRPLFPLRPEELPELHDALREEQGGGFVQLDLIA